MITHEIVVAPESANNYQHTNPQSAWYQNTTNRWPNITNQADLDKWLENCPYAVGDYVTYSRLPLNSHQIPMAIYQVGMLCEDYQRLTTQSYAPYHFRLLFLQTLENAEGNSTAEWRDVSNLRKLSNQEVEELVRPWLDRVRNSRKSHA